MLKQSEIDSRDWWIMKSGVHDCVRYWSVNCPCCIAACPFRVFGGNDVEIDFVVAFDRDTGEVIRIKSDDGVIALDDGNSVVYLSSMEKPITTIAVPTPP